MEVYQCQTKQVPRFRGATELKKNVKRKCLKIQHVQSLCFSKCIMSCNKFCSQHSSLSIKSIMIYAMQCFCSVICLIREVHMMAERGKCTAKEHTRCKQPNAANIRMMQQKYMKKMEQKSPTRQNVAITEIKQEQKLRNPKNECKRIM